MQKSQLIQIWSNHVDILNIHLSTFVGFYFRICAPLNKQIYLYTTLWLFGNRPMHSRVKTNILYQSYSHTCGRLSFHMHTNSTQGRHALDGYFCLCTHFLHDVKHAIGARWLVIPNHACNHLPRIKFWSSHEYRVHYKDEVCHVYSSGYIGLSSHVGYRAWNDRHILSTVSNLFQTHVHHCRFLDPHLTTFPIIS